MAVVTKQYGQPQDAIITTCRIYPGVDFAHGEKVTGVYEIDNAMWDTGATCSLISPKAVKKLNIKPFDVAGISSANGIITTNTYLVHVALPSGDVVTNVVALENYNPDYDVVIGMDIIGQGDFCFTNKDGKSTFSFRIPSEEEIVLE